jgi:hypothetical protein
MCHGASRQLLLATCTHLDVVPGLHMGRFPSAGGIQTRRAPHGVGLCRRVTALAGGLACDGHAGRRSDQLTGLVGSPSRCANNCWGAPSSFAAAGACSTMLPPFFARFATPSSAAIKVAAHSHVRLSRTHWLICCGEILLLRAFGGPCFMSGAYDHLIAAQHRCLPQTNLSRMQRTLLCTREDCGRTNPFVLSEMAMGLTLMDLCPRVFLYSTRFVTLYALYSYRTLRRNKRMWCSQI